MLCPACGIEGVRCVSTRETYTKLAFFFSDAAIERFETPADLAAWLDSKAGSSLPIADALASIPLEGWPDHEDGGEDPGSDDDLHILTCPSCGARFKVTDRSRVVDGKDVEDWTIRRLDENAK